MKMNNLYGFVVLCFLVVFSIPNTNAREVISIDKNWTYSNGIQLRGGFGRGFGRSNADTVNLPHTWNSTDFMSEEGYRRG